MECSFVVSISTKRMDFPRSFLCFLILFFIISLNEILSAEAFTGTYGVNYGRVADNLPPPESVVTLLKAAKIKNVRIYDTNKDVLKAFSKSGIEIVVCVPNEILKDLSLGEDRAMDWIKENVQPFLPGTSIRGISIGNEVLGILGVDFWEVLLPAAKNIYSALDRLDLTKVVQVQSPHSEAVFANSFPPSSCTFRDDVLPFMKPLLQFFSQIGSPFFINAGEFSDSLPSSPMGYENDPFRDEDGEPLMDYDGVQSDREQSPEPRQEFLDDDDEGEWQRERSQTPVYDAEASSMKAKPRKRLVKKSDPASAKEIVTPSLVDEDEDEDEDGEDFERNSKKWKEGKSGGKKEKRHKGEKRGFSSTGKSDFGRLSKRGGFSSGKDREGEVKEMWDTIAGGDSEDDHEGVRTVDDDNFIDDTGVDPAIGYGNDDEPRSPDAPQAEEGDEDDDEIDQLFKQGKKKKKNERNPAEIALLVENVMAELEVTAEEDADLNRQAKPAVNKLKKLPLLTEVLSKKQLQQEFLDHGVLNLLKNWLEPLPDGSLPNINIRAAILKILTDFPIDLEQYDRREQLKKSGIGKVIMFLSKSDEETTSNRKLAKDLVDKWSRPIFNKSTRFEDMRNNDDERVPYRRPPVKKPANKAAGMESRDGDLDLDEFSRERKSSQSSSRQHATRPEATPLDFLVRPQSKIDPDEIRARAKQVVQDQRRLKMNKKLQQLKAPKKKQLQATKLSVEGRGMVKYL